MPDSGKEKALFTLKDENGIIFIVAHTDDGQLSVRYTEDNCVKRAEAALRVVYGKLGELERAEALVRQLSEAIIAREAFGEG